MWKDLYWCVCTCIWVEDDRSDSWIWDTLFMSCCLTSFSNHFALEIDASPNTGFQMWGQSWRWGWRGRCLSQSIMWRHHCTPACQAQLLVFALGHVYAWQRHLNSPSATELSLFVTFTRSGPVFERMPGLRTWAGAEVKITHWNWRTEQDGSLTVIGGSW